jgi:hypothetical protein
MAWDRGYRVCACRQRVHLDNAKAGYKAAKQWHGTEAIESVHADRECIWTMQRPDIRQQKQWHGTEAIESVHADRECIWTMQRPDIRQQSNGMGQRL